MTREEILRDIANIIKDGNEKVVLFQKNNQLERIREEITTVKKYHILKSEEARFSLLLDLERANYLLNNGDNLALNNELSHLCKVNIGSNINVEEYQNLLRILNNTSLADKSNLLEYKGYYTTIEDRPEFVRLCKKLIVGPQKRITEMSDEEIDERVAMENKKDYDQYIRISEYMKKMSYEKEQDTNNSFEDIILLIVCKKLTLDDLKVLANRHTKREMNELLDELNQRKLFNIKEINDFREELNNSSLTCSNINELVGILYMADNIEPKSLEIFKSSMDSYDYYELISRLYELGKISYTDYLDYRSQVGPKKG